MKNLRENLIMFSIVVIGFVMVFIYPICMYSSQKPVTFTVQEKERVQTKEDSYYLVWSTDNRTYKVADSLLFFTWDSSDRYGRLVKGKQVTVTTVGWRVPFLSMYENIIEVR